MADLTTRNDGSLEKVTISTTEGTAEPIAKLAAMINPKEIGITRPVGWKKHDKAEADNPTMEFTGSAEPKTMDLELLFDTYEVPGAALSVYDSAISLLEKYAAVDTKLKRPPVVDITWGQWKSVFKGVISNIVVKYTMFLPEGIPVRATATVKLTHAEKAVVKGDKQAPAKGNSGTTAKAGQRMDELAKLFNKTPRQLARENNLETMAVSAGQNIKTS